MKSVVLAILLTGVAGFIGLMAGVLIASAVFPLMAPAPGPNGLAKAMPWYTSWVMVGLPTVGTMAGVVVGWLVIGQMKDPAYEAGHCGKCGYDLKHLASTNCPECGEPIAVWQQRKLR